MSYRNAGVAVAVLSLLASAGFAFAADGTASTAAPQMSIAPTPLTLDAASYGPLMTGLDQLGLASPIDKAGFNIYGWIEAGYTYNTRNSQYSSAYESQRVYPGAFNPQVTNSVDLNSVSIVFQRKVDSSKGTFDVGGKVWVSYGTDSDFTKSNGMQIYAGVDQVSPTYQFDFPEAYVDVAVPVKGLSFRAGKFATLIGYESLDPTQGNPFYSRSWLYSLEPITQTGVLAMYTLNDQWSFTGGVTRGWDQALKDNNGSPDFLGQAVFTLNKQWAFTLNSSVGPEDTGDTSHYRILLDPIATFQATDKLKLAAEGLYVQDGGLQGAAPTVTHAYGDYYGGAVYASYALNDMFTLNARGEIIHAYTHPTSADVYEATLGVTITPMPKDKILSNLSIRPEVRYDASSQPIFATPVNNWNNQLTFAADVIMKF